jgi:cytochrome P450
LLAEVRAAGPVLRSDGSWIVLGHAEALAALAHPAGRSGFVADLYRSVLPAGAAREEMSNRINFLDPPDHTRVRRLVSKAFTPRRVATLRPYVADLCRTLLAPLAGETPVDLIAAFAHQVPSLVISQLLGVPTENRDRLTHLADRVSRLLGAFALERAEMDDSCAAAEELHAVLRELLAERRRDPRDDLLGALSAVEEEGDRLSQSELLSLAATLYSAGHRTTRDLFSNGLAVLLGDRELVAAVRSRDIPHRAAIEEFLRYETPTHYVARMFAQPVELSGIEIAAGEPVVIMLAAANRDERAYVDAERFDPRRWLVPQQPPAPLSFAFGSHFCLGAGLARLEAEVMLETLLDELPDVALADAALRWRHTGLFRGLEALVVVPGRPRTG